MFHRQVELASKEPYIVLNNGTSLLLNKPSLEIHKMWGMFWNVIRIDETKEGKISQNAKNAMSDIKDALNRWTENYANNLKNETIF